MGIEKNDIDVVVHCQLYGIGGDVRRRSDQYAIYLADSNLKAPVLPLHQKAIAVLAQICSIAIDHELQMITSNIALSVICPL